MELILEIQETHLFLYGQLEYNKMKFANTDDNRYLRTMHKFNQAKNVLRLMEETVSRLNKENIELKKQFNNLKNLEK